jgi:WD40 repeat protein
VPGHDARVHTIVFSPDSRWLATIGNIDYQGGGDDKIVRLWKLTATGHESPRFLRGHEERIADIAFSGDSRWLVTTSEDQTTRIWDLSTENPAIAQIVLGESGWPLEASADGRWVTSPGRVWHLRAHDLISRAGETVGRNFTPAEWELFFPGEPYRKTFGDLPEPVSEQGPGGQKRK